MKSVWKLSLLSTLFAAWAFAALPASADTVSYELNASGCTTCTLPAGTVTLTQTTLDSVTVNVGLSSGYDFHQTKGKQHYAFDFNNANKTITGTNVSVTNPTGTFTFHPYGTYGASPLGSFNYAYSLAANPGNSGLTSLSFLLSDGGNPLNINSFGSNGSAYFSTDLCVASGSGCSLTGDFGASDPVPPLSSVPEPSSLLLFGTGVLGFAFLGLKHGRAAKGAHPFETSGGLA